MLKIVKLRKQLLDANIELFNGGQYWLNPDVEYTKKDEEALDLLVQNVLRVNKKSQKKLGEGWMRVYSSTDFNEDSSSFELGAFWVRENGGFPVSFETGRGWSEKHLFQIINREEDPDLDHWELFSKFLRKIYLSENFELSEEESDSFFWYENI